MTHAIYQSKRRKQKGINPGIGINFRYEEAAEYLSKCPKFGEVDENDGVKMQLITDRWLVCGVNEEAACDVGTSNRLYHDSPVTITTLTTIRNSTQYSNKMTSKINRTSMFINVDGGNEQSVGGENIVRAPDGIVVNDVNDIIKASTEHGTYKITDEFPCGIKYIKHNQTEGMNSIRTKP